MIEFKAECGHTVRARDEDAGSVVRCSYCGRNADVPEQDGGDLAFLFRDVTQPKETKKRRRRRRKRKPEQARSTKLNTFDPFALTLKLCYLAALIVVSIVVARKWVLPLFEERSAPVRTVQEKATGGPTAAASTEREYLGASPGLIGRAATTGLYVASTPPGATVYCVEASKMPGTGRISPSGAGFRQFRANGNAQRLSDGDYVVEVMFPWNHPSLSSQTLSDYSGYLSFRRGIEQRTPDERRALMRDYFLPDAATDVFVDQTADQIYLVRQYRSIAIHQGRCRGVRSIFLPRIKKENGAGFSLEPLMPGYVPPKKHYEFKEAHVRGELAYYQVAQRDVRYVIDVLTRIGVVPYVTPDGRTRLFKIDIHDGAFSAPIIENLEE